jgi:Tfp pilus assembly protein PilF
MGIYLIIIAIVLVGIFVRRYLITVKGIYFEYGILPSSSRKTKMKNDPIIQKNPISSHEAPTKKTAPKVVPKSMEAKMMYSQAMTYFDRGQLEEAEKKLIQVASLDSDFCEADHRLGLIYLKQEQYGKAEAIFNKLISQNGDDAVFYSNLGRALYGQSKMEEALAAYLKAVELDPSRAGRFVSAAEIYRQLENEEKAQKMYKKALELDPSNIDYLLTFAHFLIEDKKFSQAKFYLEKVLKLQPDNSIALEMMKEVKE